MKVGVTHRDSMQSSRQRIGEEGGIALCMITSIECLTGMGKVMNFKFSSVSLLGAIVSPLFPSRFPAYRE